jgi:DNA-nicking Smr family endonuclease
MNDEITHIEPGNELDLHHFHPRDARALLHDFIDSAAEKGLHEIRIVHGKGRSVIKGIVHAELGKRGDVLSFRDEPGNWGATIVRLK